MIFIEADDFKSEDLHYVIRVVLIMKYIFGFKAMNFHVLHHSDLKRLKSNGIFKYLQI
jgi:hypothetical protein